jgi:hypothetical protein
MRARVYLFVGTRIHNNEINEIFKGNFSSVYDIGDFLKDSGIEDFTHSGEGSSYYYIGKISRSFDPEEGEEMAELGDCSEDVNKVREILDKYLPQLKDFKVRPMAIALWG